MNSRERARKKGKKKVTPLHVVVAAVLALGISALVILYTDSFGFASVLRGFFTASESEFVDPDGMQMVNGDFTVNDAGTTLENKHITGNLYLGPGIGDGSLKLFNVVVEGSVLVQGGGLNSIYLTDSTIGIVRVNRPEGRIKLVVAGKTVVGQTFLETGALLVEELAADFVGFDEVEVLTAEKTELNGSFSAVLILVEGAEVHISSEELALLTITGTAIGARVHIAENVVIDKLTIDAPAYLLGQGEFGLTTVSAAGITGLAGSFRQVRVSSEAGHLDLGEGTVQQLVVERSALKNSISVAKEAAVTDLELNEAVEVSGAGAVQKILINAPGSTIAQIPFEIEFGQDVSVLIGGHVISNPAMLHALRVHGDPLFGAPGRVVAEAPRPAPPPAAPALPPPAPPAPAPAPPPPAPDPIRDFRVAPGITPGKTMVIVILAAPDPENFQVLVGNTPLTYSAAINGFRGEVDTADAVRSKVVIAN